MNPEDACWQRRLRGCRTPNATRNSWRPCIQCRRVSFVEQPAGRRCHSRATFKGALENIFVPTVVWPL